MWRCDIIRMGARGLQMVPSSPILLAPPDSRFCLAPALANGPSFSWNIAAAASARTTMMTTTIVPAQPSGSDSEGRGSPAKPRFSLPALEESSSAAAVLDTAGDFAPD